MLLSRSRSGISCVLLWISALRTFFNIFSREVLSSIFRSACRGQLAFFLLYFPPAHSELQWYFPGHSVFRSRSLQFDFYRGFPVYQKAASRKFLRGLL